MKTILINYLGRNNSAPFFSYSVGKALKENGYDVIAVVSKHATNISDWRNYGFREIYEVDTYTSGKNLIFKSICFLLVGKRKLKKKFDSENIDYIINTFFHPWSNIVSDLWKEAVKITFCHDPILHDGVNRIMRVMYPLFIRRGDHVVVLTKKFVDIVEKDYGIDRKRIHYCPHGRMDLYKNNISSCRPMDFPEYKNEYINFVFFGRIEKYKGLDVLGKAYEIIKSKHSNVSLSIYGAGDLGAYTDLIQHQDVRIVNKYISDEDIGWIFNGANIVLVLPYENATQSGVIPIAFEYGTPVICSDLTGLREQLDDGNAGIYFDAGNEKSLADAMELFISDKKVYNGQSEKMLNLSDKIEWYSIIGNLMKEIDKC
ncbi:glycosyltransferase [Butyrivibrio sp. DSM 10294]|uniref:glycosyltransferase n=1 Tax=Butyrivibrio sp. DSM 10294 TaxID=2972457 RepID=UPI00234EF22B|nr:glycosyltransferase [Butyrivibrio sp. DSM 10294]MDC7292857.1 glycosyltransferase [Butyrivibrio sp. DSM 10294]